MPFARVVLDTNVLVSALIAEGTPPGELYRAWRDGDLELLTSAAQIHEIVRVLSYPRLRDRIDARKAALLAESIAARALVVLNPPPVDLSPDPSDNPILAAAIAGRADLVVSGDRRHMLALGEVGGIPILAARDAIGRLRGM